MKLPFGTEVPHGHRDKSTTAAANARAGSGLSGSLHDAPEPPFFISTRHPPASLWWRHSMMACSVARVLFMALLGLAPGHAVRRMTFRDGKLYEPERPDKPVILRGVNFVFTVNRPGFALSPDDRRFMDLMPDANVVRLVMDHFHDNHAVGTTGLDCHSEDPLTGYIQPACLAQFDDVLAWTSREARVWAIFTGRGSHDSRDMPGIWANSTLRAQMVASWTYLARRYASLDNILGYEVMSEPRNNDNVAVHALHVEACDAVWAADAAAACVVGATNYSRYALNTTILLPHDRPVLYAANLFEPKAFVTGDSANASYPETVDCCTGTPACTSAYMNTSLCEVACGCDGKWQTACCAAAPAKTIDKQWLLENLESVRAFSAANGVPVWIDQWGVHNHAGAAFGPARASAMQEQYVRDALEAFEIAGLHWTYWIWRRPPAWAGWECDSPEGTYAILCQNASGGGYRLSRGGALIKQLNAAINGSIP